MSKKIYIIGDCHTSRVQEHYKKEESDVDIIFWGKAAKKIFDLDFKKMSTEPELSSGKESQMFENDGVIPFSEVKDDGVVFSWFGYVDIRTFLTKYNNPEEIAKLYVDQLKSYFSNSKIIIIEPLPQFTEMLLKYEGISPYYTHEERINQNNLFLKHLHDYCKENNINNFITQDEILKTLGVRELTPSMTHTKAPHPVDGLKDEYNTKIFDLFYKYALREAQ
jgi:hypothetical protein